MNEPPCLCTAGYRCNRCRRTAWEAKQKSARDRMRDNKLAALAKDFEVIDDDQWCVLLYTSEQDDLDLLLFRGEAS